MNTPMNTVMNTPMNTVMNINISTDINNTTIYNYFIDKDVIIKDNDNIETKIKKNVIKYKKIIAIICFIILLIIGYYYNIFNIEIENNIINENSVQKGGSIDTAMPDIPKQPGFLSKVGSSIKNKVDKKTTKGAAELSIKSDKAQKGVQKGLSSLKKGASKAISPSTYYNAGAAAARKFKDNAGIIYQILYAIALFIVFCIVTIPAIAFIIIGFFCYFLLKNRMKTIKGL